MNEISPVRELLCPEVAYHSKNYVKGDYFRFM